jgi:adenylate cyclase
MIAEYLKDDINIENRYFYSFLSGTSNQVLSKEYDEDKNRPVNLTKEANRFFEKSRSNTAYMNEIIESARSAAVFRVAQQIMPQFISPDNRPDKTKIFKLLTEKIKWNSGYALISSKSIEQIIDRAAGLAVFEKNNSLNVINMSGLDLSGFMDPDIPSYTLSSRALLGYINAEPEADGVYRKVSLLKQYEGGFYPQLAMSALLAYLNFDFSKDSIVISPDRKLNIIVSDKKKYSIPLNENGEFFINWVPEVYENSFQHLSAAFLINYYDLLIQRIEQLSSLEAEFLPNFLGMTNIKSIYEKMISLRGRPGYEDSPEYQALLNKSRSFEKMLVSFIKRRVKKLSHIVNSIKDPNEAQEINNSVARLEKVLKSLDNRASYLKRAEEKIRKTVENKISIVGMSATSNTDIGAVPFQKNYPMCGTHANILNTIFTEQFIYTLPRGMELFFLVILGILTGFSIPKFKIANGAAFCIFQTFFYSVCAYLLFIKRFILIDLFTPLFVIFATYLLISVLRFIYEEKQKKFIKAAFGQYLAPVLVEQITKDPSKLRLGGERKICTSYFSDVAGFSTISEKLSPEELVSLLNEYLTAMTDIIIANKGTIDKYEGDAIIALFGAPVDYEDHAACACRASVEMQKLLVNMRAQWARQGKHELYVRMGLNSGPMVVGNMGSTQRMDYTMMGDTVNLAARLEGANKPYGTYTMISEYTYNMCSSLFDVRELDRIRVVGKKEPVTVYELLDNKNCLESKKAGVVELFLKGLELYKKCDWKGALKVFDRVLKLDPNDQPSRVYIQRCVEFIKTPPPKDWDGVYVLKSK